MKGGRLLLAFGSTGISPVQFAPHTWFDATRISGVADGAALSSWVDISGNGRNATQATGANQPLYIANGQNGKPVVRFDGSNDNLKTAAFTALTQPSTIFVVAKAAANATTQYFVDGIGASNRHAIYKDSTNIFRAFAGADFASSPAVTYGIWHVFCVVFNGTSSKKFLDGSSVATGDAGAHTLTGLTLGAANNGTAPLNGDIAEVTLFNQALTDVIIQQLSNQYYRPKWGI